MANSDEMTLGGRMAAAVAAEELERTVTLAANSISFFESRPRLNQDTREEMLATP
jgi:hypothetical protein